MQLSIQTNFPQVRKALSNLSTAVRGPATASAINKTLDYGATLMGRLIVSEFNVKLQYVRERLRFRRATAKGGVNISGSLIGGKDGAKRSANIIAFVEKKTSLADARRRRKAGTLNQLFVKIKRTAPAKPLPGAFIGNHGRTVFRRVGKERLPIEPVQVIDVAQMFNTKRINGKVVIAMQAKFPEIFNREARFYTDRFNRGAMR